MPEEAVRTQATRRNRHWASGTNESGRHAQPIPSDEVVTTRQTGQESADEATGTCGRASRKTTGVGDGTTSSERAGAGERRSAYKDRFGWSFTSMSSASPGLLTPGPRPFYPTATLLLRAPRTHGPNVLSVAAPDFTSAARLATLSSSAKSHRIPSRPISRTRSHVRPALRAA